MIPPGVLLAFLNLSPLRLTVTHTRADDLIAELQLQPHPEGGYFREIYRSATLIRRDQLSEKRTAVTTIYFLLKQGQFSCLHQVTSDEIWHFYEGDPIELTWGQLDGSPYQRRLLGPVSPDCSPTLVVPAQAWQAARTTGAYTLVGCTVAPGFEFRDFRMLADSPTEAAVIRARYPELQDLV